MTATVRGCGTVLNNTNLGQLMKMKVTAQLTLTYKKVSGDALTIGTDSHFKSLRQSSALISLVARTVLILVFTSSFVLCCL